MAGGDLHGRHHVQRRHAALRGRPRGTLRRGRQLGVVVLCHGARPVRRRSRQAVAPVGGANRHGADGTALRRYSRRRPQGLARVPVCRTDQLHQHRLRHASHAQGHRRPWGVGPAAGTSRRPATMGSVADRPGGAGVHGGLRVVGCGGHRLLTIRAGHRRRHCGGRVCPERRRRVGRHETGAARLGQRRRPRAGAPGRRPGTALHHVLRLSVHSVVGLPQQRRGRNVRPAGGGHRQ